MNYDTYGIYFLAKARYCHSVSRRTVSNVLLWERGWFDKLNMCDSSSLKCYHKISFSLGKQVVRLIGLEIEHIRDLSRQHPKFYKSDVVIKRESCVVSSLFNLKSNIPHCRWLKTATPPFAVYCLSS